MQKRQSISQSSQIQINNKLNEFKNEAIKEISKSEDVQKWFIEEVIKKNRSKIPRIKIIDMGIDLLRAYSTNKILVDQMFRQQKHLYQMISQVQNLVDMALILKEHVNASKSKQKIKDKDKSAKISYKSSLMDIISNRIDFLMQRQKGKYNSLFKVNYVFSFIDFKQNNPKQIYNLIPLNQLKYVEEQICYMYVYLIRPWIEQKNPTRLYEHLTILTYWNIIIDDDSPQKVKLLLSLNQNIQNILCFRKRSDGIFNYLNVFSLMMNILAVNYRKQDPFKIYGLAPLMNLFETSIQSDEINYWLQAKGKTLKAQQIENIFRNSYHSGSTIFILNLINEFSKSLKRRKQYNVLYHLYLSYIKKQYLDFVLPNPTFIPCYFDILEFYVIGFINQDRLQGQSQLDKLTHNLSSILLRRAFSYKEYNGRLIMFYKVYQARFSYLSTVSKKFLSDLQRKYKYFPQLSEVYNKIQQLVFRDAGFAQEQNSGFQQLNIKQTDRYRGMMNLGNTCYMNSFMQALFMTKKFRSTILDIRDQQSLPSTKTLFYALINLFTEMSTKNITMDSEIIPELFKNQTPQPFKSSWQQHDVGQYGRIYFQSLTNQLDDDKNKERIQKIFFNKINKDLICTKCRNKKQKVQKVFDIILHLNKQDQNILVSKLLFQYFQGQQLSDENQVVCEKCNKKTNHISRLHPVKFPQHIIITIGLFQYSGGGKKIKKPFNFQFSINFSKILPSQNMSDEIYELYAFIVHIGNQAERGHYICYARNLQENPIVWYCFDDGYVSERQIETVSDFKFGQSETPYLLFYSVSKKKKPNQVQTSNILHSSSHIYNR